MRTLIFESAEMKAYVTDEHAIPNSGQPVLEIEYGENSPVRPGECIAYRDADLLEDGVFTAAGMGGGGRQFRIREELK